MPMHDHQAIRNHRARRLKTRLYKKRMESLAVVTTKLYMSWLEKESFPGIENAAFDAIPFSSPKKSSKAPKARKSSAQSLCLTILLDIRRPPTATRHKTSSIVVTPIIVSRSFRSIEFGGRMPPWGAMPDGGPLISGGGVNPGGGPVAPEGIVKPAGIPVKLDDTMEEMDGPVIVAVAASGDIDGPNKPGGGPVIPAGGVNPGGGPVAPDGL
ncbi:MAG: hypothetical protein Q9164_002970 [Protoblastenia rupestris]